MFSELYSVFFDLWRTWAELFSFIPHGNPYAAIFLPVIMGLCVGNYYLGRKTKNDRRHTFGDQYERAELYRRIQNIR